ncbi:MAG: shikimate dehydrogenase [Candidatus Thioglobus sp.]|nr:MAG: shikimate dehydrogenase [Candidatus Thioglobus sp.]
MHKLAVFGNPIEHSLSPKIHAIFAQQTGVYIEYSKQLAPIGDFKQVAQDFIKQGGTGFNITVPFKIQAFEIADELTKNAQAAGAVNTIKVQGAKLIGENTDGIGLMRDLSANLGVSLQGKTLLIIGAGGASRGIILPLLEQNPKRLMIANRTASKAISLANEFAKYGKTCGFGLEKIKPSPVDIIINASSAALNNEMPNIPDETANGAICYDLMYGKTTKFMQWAQANNAIKVVDGVGMLVEQAAASFEFWTGKRPMTMAVIKELAK